MILDQYSLQYTKDHILQISSIDKPTHSREKLGPQDTEGLHLQIETSLLILLLTDEEIRSLRHLRKQKLKMEPRGAQSHTILEKTILGNKRILIKLQIRISQGIFRIRCIYEIKN